MTAAMECMETSGETLAAGVSIVIPAYRSEKTLEMLVKRLIAALESFGGEFEIICVNDASPDGTWKVLERLHGAYRRRLTAIDLLRNSGQHAALLCGIRAARYQTIVTMDDDLQHPPEEISRLLAALADGADVAYGVPIQERHGLLRDVASVVAKRALAKTVKTMPVDKISAFRAFRTELRNAFRKFDGPLPSIDVLLSWGAVRYASVPLRHDRREHGVSNYTFQKLLLHTLNMLTGFSVMPLRAVAVAGLALMAGGLCGVAASTVSGGLGGVSTGTAMLAGWMAICSGAQLTGMGVLGEYLARMHLQLQGRPAYTIASTLSSTRPDASNAKRAA